MELDKEEVETLAYKLWQDRGSPIGSPEEDWFHAEAELRQQDPKHELPVFAFPMEPAEW